MNEHLNNKPTTNWVLANWQVITSIVMVIILGAFMKAEQVNQAEKIRNHDVLIREISDSRQLIIQTQIEQRADLKYIRQSLDELKHK